MKREVVEAVNGQSITTESGEKICIGNHAFDVGESVWVDGRYAFGNDRRSAAPIVHEIGVGESKPCFVACVFIYNEEEDNNEMRFRIFDSKLNYIEIPANTNGIMFDKFCYNQEGSEFTGFVFHTYSDNVSIYKFNSKGVTRTDIEIPSTYQKYTVDCYYNNDNELIWHGLFDDFYYSHKLSASASSTSVTEGTVKLGTLAYYDYKGTELQKSHDYTNNLISNDSSIWAEMAAYANAENRGISVTGATTREFILDKSPWSTPAYNSGSVQNYNNKPREISYHAGQASVYNFSELKVKASLVGIDYLWTSSIVGGYFNYSYNESSSAWAYIRTYIATVETYVCSKDVIFNNDSSSVYNKRNVKQTPLYVYVQEVSSYYIYNVSITGTYETTSDTYSEDIVRDVGCDYTLTISDTVTTLSKGTWSMDLSDIIAAPPCVVTALSETEILLTATEYNTSEKNCYIIDIKNKTYTTVEKMGETSVNSRMPMIFSTSSEDIIQILSQTYSE